MKLVADANIWVSGSLWDGAPARLLDAALTGHAPLFISTDLLAELQDVLDRPKFARRLESRGLTPATVMARVRHSCRTIEPTTIAAPAELRDLDDLAVLACAVAVRADAIVTGDDDLLALRAFRGIPILTATQALERLQK